MQRLCLRQQLQRNSAEQIDKKRRGCLTDMLAASFVCWLLATTQPEAAKLHFTQSPIPVFAIKKIRNAERDFSFFAIFVYDTTVKN